MYPSMNLLIGDTRSVPKEPGMKASRAVRNLFWGDSENT